jgi:uncharacterized protein YcgI (DUF1989 family)
MAEMSQTSTTTGARDHARAQASASVRGMPVVPPTTTTDPPPGVPASAVLWDEVIEPGEYAAHRLPAGAALRLVDLDGDGCAHVLVHNARQPSERLNLADTVKVQWQAYLGARSALLSDMGRSLLTIVADGSQRHDALCGSPPAARACFVLALAKAGLDRRDVGPSFAFFKRARVEADGALVPEVAPQPPGTQVLLRCDLDVHVAVVAVPHVLDDRPSTTGGAVRITAWRPSTPLTIDAASPELGRAYANIADWRGGW